MLPGIEMMGCQNLAVPAEVMSHVVQVESGGNPFAIGVVGGRLARQPKNLDEAVATANMLEAKGYNYSLGLAQVNRVNFGRYGLDTPAKAFDVCANLLAGAQVLADCFRSAGGRAEDWGKAFSCYYSGNFTTGFLQGYVQKIYNSIFGSAQAQADAKPAVTAAAIPVVPMVPASEAVAYAVAMSAAPTNAAPKIATPTPGRPASPARSVRIAAAAADTPATAAIPSTAAGRVALRSVPIGNATPATVSVATSPSPAAVASAVSPVAASGGNNGGSRRVRTVPTPVVGNLPAAMVSPSLSSDVFKPQVRNPNEPPPAAAAATGDPADRRQETPDSAFVF